MKYCPECGASVEGMKFCPECGENLSEKSPLIPVDGTEVINVEPYFEQNDEAEYKIEKITFWNKKIFIAVFAFICTPLSLVFVWVNETLKKSHKIFLTILLIILTFSTSIFPIAIIADSISSGGSGRTYTKTADENFVSVADYKNSCVAYAYSDLARTPDVYEGKYILITGKVVQALSDANSDEGQYRVAMNDDYDQIIYVFYDNGFANGRILEDDEITFWATSNGLVTYTSTLGGEITIPSANARFYDITASSEQV